MDDNVTREEFGSFIAEFESFRDTIFDEFSKLREDIEKIKYNLEELESSLKENKLIDGLGRRKLG